MEYIQPTVYKFYDTYVKLLQQDYDSRKESNKEPTEIEEHLKDANFRNFIIDKLGKTYDTIVLLSKSIVTGMLKPQRLILDHVNFYIACDMITNTYYICYRYLLMIDVDLAKVSYKAEDILKIFDDDLEHSWMVYKSRSGYHAFLVSHKADYQNRSSVELMLKFSCDFYYVIYSYLRGYSVRLNPKKDDQDEQGDLYNYLGVYGSKSKVISRLVNLVNLHIDMTNIFSKEGCSLMS